MTAVPGRQHYNLTLAILTMAGTAFALQQTMVFPALTTFQHEFDTTAAWATWVLTAFLLTASVATPLLGKLGDQHGKERMLVIALCDLPARHDRRRLRVGHRLAHLLPRRRGGRRRRLPAELRDHPRRVPAREGEGRDRAAVGRVRRGRGPRNRPLGADRRQPLVALAVRRGRDSRRGLDRARPPLRAGVADQDTRAARRARRACSLGAALVSLLIALTEGDHWGWTSRVLRCPSSPRRGLLLLALDLDGAARRGADGRHAHDEPAARSAHEHRPR